MNEHCPVNIPLWLESRKLLCQFHLKCVCVIINQCQQVKLLGVTTDSKLNFDEHICELCCKVNKNASAFLRLKNYLDNTQAELLCKPTVLANFNYCLLIWMFSLKLQTKRSIEHISEH